MRFFPTELITIADEILNPSRGWYEIYHFNIEEKTDFEELRWCLRSNQTVALLRVSLKAVKSRIIEEEELENLDEIFRFFIQAGKEIILRIAYDTEGKENEPTLIELIYFHITQIGRIVRKYEDNIVAFQGILTGSWGEMHHSMYSSRKNICQLSDKVRKEVGTNIVLELRMPVHIRYLMEKENDRREEDRVEQFAEENKIGLFNDGIFGSDTHLGTFADRGDSAEGWNLPWGAEEEHSFIEQIGTKSICIGEVVQGIREYSLEEVCETLKKLRISCLNCAHDLRLLDQWKKKYVQSQDEWNGISWFDYVGRRLGYRLVVRKIKVKNVFPGKLYVQIKLENIGFSPVYDELEVGILAGVPSQNTESAVNKAVCSGAEYSAVLKIKAIPGKMYFFVKRKQDGQYIRIGTREKREEGSIENSIPEKFRDAVEAGICIGELS